MSAAKCHGGAGTELGDINLSGL